MKEIKSYQTSDGKVFLDYGHAIDHERGIFMGLIAVESPRVEDLLDHFESQDQWDHRAQILNLTKAYFVAKGLTVGWSNHYNF